MDPHPEAAMMRRRVQEQRPFRSPFLRITCDCYSKDRTINEVRAAVIASLALASCVAATAPPSQETAGTVRPLAGTRWQLVQFRSSDKGTLKPGDPARYVMDLMVDG